MNNINNPLYEVEQNLENVTEKIKISLLAANRPPNDTTLVAVSKLQPADKIEVALRKRSKGFWRKPGPGSCSKMAVIKEELPLY